MIRYTMRENPISGQFYMAASPTGEYVKHDELAALAGAEAVAWRVTCHSDDDCDSSDDYSQYVSDFAFVELLQSHGVFKSVTPLFTHAPAKAREVTDEVINRALFAYDLAMARAPAISCRSVGIRAALATVAEGE